VAIGPDIVHLHSAPSADAVIFHDELRELEKNQSSYRLHLQLTETNGHLDLNELDTLVPDWRDRLTWACGPASMLDTAEKVLQAAGLHDGLHLERFTIARTDKGGEGGTVVFSVSDKRVEIDGATSLLEAGEKVGIQMRRLLTPHSMAARAEEAPAARLLAASNSQDLVSCAAAVEFLGPLQEVACSVSTCWSVNAAGVGRSSGCIAWARAAASA
jgi:hypothetical protein